MEISFGLILTKLASHYINLFFFIDYHSESSNLEVEFMNFHASYWMDVSINLFRQRENIDFFIYF